ncbi:MAG: DUF1579 domain-containing protein [Sphingosinicella sp.]|nr:DUF1579 domain-containing protein [Sphingosinicella sp.]
MLRLKSILAATGLMLAIAATPVAAQAPDRALLRKQKEAMAALAFLDGEWAGPAEAQEPSGLIKMTQTERSGTLLDGTIRLVEGRSYDGAGKTLFNAFAVISYDVRTGHYLITSHASGYAISTQMKVSGHGFEWEIPAGPQAKMHFKAVVENGVWTEVGEYVGPSGKPRRTFHMEVRKLRPTAWPAGSLVSYK